jgi:hypothetical protein
MAEFPRRLNDEGGTVLELFPSVYYAHYPQNEEAIGEGERVGYEEFRLVARDLGLDQMNASRAFNGIYINLRSQAYEAGLIRRTHKITSWDYLPDFGNARPHIRPHILLATQAVHDSYMAARDYPWERTLKSFRVVESLLGFDEEREVDRALALQPQAEDE